MRQAASLFAPFPAWSMYALMLFPIRTSISQKNKGILFEP